MIAPQQISSYRTLLHLCVGCVLVWLLSTPLVHAQEDDKFTVGFLVGVSGLGDQSFNDMAYAGLFKVKQEHNIRLIFEDSDKDDEAFEASMVRLLQKKSDIIVANGFYMKDLVVKYAKMHPEIYFVLQDAVTPKMQNVINILYLVNEGSFLAGSLAAMMTTTDQIGFIGGVDIPIMHVFRLGFREGAEYINPAITLREQFLSKAPDFSGFKNPTAGHEMATEYYRNNVDIIFSAAGLSGNGIIQAAKKTGKYAIGVDSDQDHMAKGHVLTSMMKRLDIATYTEVKKIILGKFKPGIVTYGLKQQGVGLSPMKFTKQAIPESVLLRLAEIKKKIINREIIVSHYLDLLENPQ